MGSSQDIIEKFGYLIFGGFQKPCFDLINGKNSNEMKA